MSFQTGADLDVDAVERALHHDLASTIAQHRGGKDAAQLADHCLEAERLDYFLVGLIDECERAVYYEKFHYSVLGIEVDVDGLGSRMGSHIETVPHPEVRAWIVEQGSEYWDWVHPQFRWVFEIDM